MPIPADMKMQGARSIEFTDAVGGHNIGRITLHQQKVYIETEGHHQGTTIYTSVCIDEVRFIEALMRMS